MVAFSWVVCFCCHFHMILNTKMEKAICNISVVGPFLNEKDKYISHRYCDYNPEININFLPGGRQWLFVNKRDEEILRFVSVSPLKYHIEL